jgi:hypothetical protein
MVAISDWNRFRETVFCSLTDNTKSLSRKPAKYDGLSILVSQSHAYEHTQQTVSKDVTESNLYQ